MKVVRNVVLALIVLAAVFVGGYVLAKQPWKTTPTTTMSTSTTTTSTIASACGGSGFTGTLQASQGAAGTIYTGVTLRNTTSSTCTFNGWPSLRYLNAASNPMATTVVRDASGFAASGAPQSPSAISVAPGASMQFLLSYSQVPAGSQSTCPTVSTIDVFLPGDTTAIAVSAGSNFTPCALGRTFVSPLFAA